MRKLLLHWLIPISAIALFFLNANTALAQAEIAASLAAKAGAQAASSGGVAGAVGSFFGGTFDIMSLVLAPVAQTIMKLLSYVTALGGVALNASIYYTVIEMSKNIGNLPAIDQAWGVVRDVANMGFIFVLLWAALKKILGVGSDVNRLIVNMIIVAILVNFSLFITKFIIDVANLLALTFYSAIAPTASLSANGFLNAGLSNSMVEALKVQSIWQTDAVYGDNIFTISILASIVLLITTFVFFAAAIMFIIRYVVLIFVLILSPIAFISHALPGLDDIASKWKGALLNQAFFAPIYMLLMWVTIVVAKGISGTVFKDASSFGNAFSAASGSTTYSPGLITILINFGVIIGFLIAALVISKQVSYKAGMGIGKLTEKAIGGAGGFAFGTVLGGAGRKTLGRFGQASADNADLVKRANEGTGIRGASARLGLYAAKKLASGTFDVRNAAIPTSAVGDLARGTIGRTGVGRAIGADDFRTSSIAAVSGAAALTGVGAGGDKGYKELEDEKKKRLREEAKQSAEELKKAQRKLSMEQGIQASRTSAGSRTPAQDAAIKDLVKTIQQMSDKDVESQKAATLAIEEVAENLSPKQLEAIEKSDKFTDQEKDEIFSKHFAKIAAAADAVAAGTATDDQKNAIKNLSDKELDMLPTDIFDPANPGGRREAAILKTVSQSQTDALMKNKTVAEKQAIKDERNRPLNEAFSTASWATAIDLMRNMKVEDVVKLSKDKLAKDEILELYNPALLNKMAMRSELTEDKATEIRSAILRTGPSAPAGSNLQKSYDWLVGPGLNIF